MENGIGIMHNHNTQITAREWPPLNLLVILPSPCPCPMWNGPKCEFEFEFEFEFTSCAMCICPCPCPYPYIATHRHMNMNTKTGTLLKTKHAAIFNIYISWWAHGDTGFTVHIPHSQPVDARPSYVRPLSRLPKRYALVPHTEQNMPVPPTASGDLHSLHLQTNNRLHSPQSIEMAHHT